jgi:enoyl-CoA hydratase/carnithine racemase
VPEPVELASGRLLLDRPAEAVARLTLTNPEKRNPLDHDVLDALAATLPELAAGIETRCLVVTGSGRAFSAGYDIGAIPEQSFERDAESLVAHPFHAAMEAVSAHPYPVVAAINGHCLGGGLELAVRCDLRVCAASAKLGMPPAKLGLIYGHTGLERFIDVIGVAHTKELFLTGRNLTAERAAAIGLVNEAVADERVEAVSLELAAEIASNAPLSMTGNKRAIETIAPPPPAPHASPRKRRRSWSSSVARASPPRTSERASAPSPRSESRAGRGASGGPARLVAVVPARGLGVAALDPGAGREPLAERGEPLLGRRGA